MAKLILARNKLLRKGDDGAEIIIAAPYDEASDEAVPVLQSFRYRYDAADNKQPSEYLRPLAAGGSPDLRQGMKQRA